MLYNEVAMQDYRKSSDCQIMPKLHVYVLNFYSLRIQFHIGASSCKFM